MTLIPNQLNLHDHIPYSSALLEILKTSLDQKFHCSKQMVSLLTLTLTHASKRILTHLKISQTLFHTEYHPVEVTLSITLLTHSLLSLQEHF